MIVVEEYPCDSKNQLHTRERYRMELLHATLNKVIPTRPHKEWREDNSEHIKERDKKYKEKSSEHTKSYQKAYDSEKIECPHCNKMFNRGSMTHHIRRKHTE